MINIPLNEDAFMNRDELLSMLREGLRITVDRNEEFTEVVVTFDDVEITKDRSYCSFPEVKQETD